MPKRSLAPLVCLTTIALSAPVTAGGLYLREFGTTTTGTASAGAPAGTPALPRGQGLGDAQIRSAFVRGSYTENDLYFLTVNVGWRKLPWAG